MDTLSTQALTHAETWLFINTLLYFLMNGAQIFETAVVVPKWAALPPQTFTLLADKNGTSLKTFWIALHSIHEIAFILSIFYCWNLEPIRNGLLILFAIHAAVRIWTIIYFAPNIIDFERCAHQSSVEALLLKKRAATWQKLNYLRVAIYLAISIAMIPLCIQLLNFRNQ